MALAGYKKEDINVTVDDGVLTVKGKSSEEKEKFVHRGIAKRAFETTAFAETTPSIRVC